jgi:hypothetical protein
MSIVHLNAAFKCKKFKGAARLLLLTLANRASDGKPRKDGKTVPYGCSYAGGGRLMADINASRDTLIDSMKILVDAEVVTRRRRLGAPSWSFVDIDALQKLAYTDEDIAEFRKKWDTKGGKSSTTGCDAKGKSLRLKSGKTTTTDVGEFPPSDVGIVPATVTGDSPTHNPKSEPQEKEASGCEPSVSESELADADSDFRYGKSSTGKSHLLTGVGEQVVIGESSDSDDKDHLVDSEDEIVVSGKGKATPARLQNNPDPDPKEYEDVVHLCSIWWSAHSNPVDEIETTTVPKPHPWGHPRTWTPAQRREAFLNGHWQGDDPNSMELVLAPDSTPEQEEEAGAPDSTKVEEALLRDEGHMLEIYLKYGRDVVEELLIWLPKSDFWFGKITSLAKLKTHFDRVYRTYEKYLLKAEESGSDVECEDFVYGIFLEAGGAAAESICYERLNPCNPADAAEEESMDAYDDEVGVDFFDVWAQLDYEAAMAEQQAEESGGDMFDPWTELDACDDNPDVNNGSMNGSEVPAFEEDAFRAPTELHSSSTNEGTLAKLFSAYYYGNAQVTNDERQLQEGSWAGVFRDMYCGQGAANTVPAFVQFLNLVKADTELSRIVLSLKPNFSLSSLLANKSRIEREKGVASSDYFEDE